jgi:outer membrane biosynthesis protein TonB
VSAVFGREPSRPLPGDVEAGRDERDGPTEAVVVDERGPEAPEGEPGPAIDLRDDDEVVSDVDDRDTEPEPVAEEPDPAPVAERPVAEPDTDTEAEPAVLPESEPVAEEPEPELAVVPVPEPEPVAEAGPGDAWVRRWDDLQATFVDDPRDALDGAADLLSEALAEATPGDAGTEDLRVAFQRYRAAFRDLHPTA